jgi:2-phosphosulfolactate phosphatase
LPDKIDTTLISGSTAVVIDVLRASSTITAALAHGAESVIPIAEPEMAFGKRLPTIGALENKKILRGGERNCVRIDGFDLGNSPLEYTRDQVAGRSILFTTTNGTRALDFCRAAKTILLACFLNLSATAEKLAADPDINFVCAGTDGEPTEEDELLAGALVARLCRSDAWDAQLNDAAEHSRNQWFKWFGGAGDPSRANHPSSAGNECPEPARLCDVLKSSRGGTNLVKNSMENDIKYCAQIDLFDCVPIFDPPSGIIS